MKQDNYDKTQDRKGSTSSKHLRFRDVRGKMRKQQYLTDTQVSADYTISSTGTQTAKIQLLEKTITQLEEENKQLRRIVIELKGDDRYEKYDKKSIIKINDNEQLKNQIIELRNKIEKIQIEKDFLSRSNQQLKGQIQNMAIDLAKLNLLSYKLNQKKQRSQQNSDRTISSKNKSVRTQKIKCKSQSSLLKNMHTLYNTAYKKSKPKQSISRFNEEYFSGRKK